MTEPIDIAALRGLLATATPGQWIVGTDADDEGVTWGFDWEVWCEGMIVAVAVQVDNDAALIAATRNALPPILDRLDRAEREVAALRSKLSSIRSIVTGFGIGYGLIETIDAGDL